MPTVNYNAIVNADADHVWRVLKQFGQISTWHPAISQSEIEDGVSDGLAGCVRRLTLQDGGVLREQLLTMDDPRRSLSYRFLESPLPLDNYVANVSLVPLTDQATTVIQWTASFDVRDPDPQGQQLAVVKDLVISGHESLGQYLAS